MIRKLYYINNIKFYVKFLKYFIYDIVIISFLSIFLF